MGGTQQIRGDNFLSDLSLGEKLTGEEKEITTIVMFWQKMGLSVPKLFICVFMIHLHHIWSDIVRYGIGDKGKGERGK